MGKTLVVFYSYTGNTEMIAKKISFELKGDLLSLEPEIPFSSDYNEVVEEWQNNSIKRDVKIKDVNVNFDLYDKIIVGTPIWWYTITPVVTAFLKKYNLNGKRIYPFYTSAGWFGKCDSDFRKICLNNNVKDSLKITFDQNYEKHLIISNENDINKWISYIREEQ